MNYRKMIKKALLNIPVMLLLSACYSLSANDGQYLADMTYEHISQAQVNAVSIQMPADFILPLNEDDMANSFIVAPSEAVNKYFAHKLVAAGKNNKFDVELEQASMFKRYVSSSSSWKSLFQLDAAYEYDMSVKFKMLMHDDSGRVISGKRLVFNKQFSILANTSIAVREAQQMEIIEGLVRDIDLAVSAYLIEDKLTQPEISR